jgi:hypothetical protein
MKIYHLTQSSCTGYDTYSDCVVCAETAEEAKLITPSGGMLTENEYNWGDWPDNVEDIECTEIGEANEDQQHGVICASFRAG